MPSPRFLRHERQQVYKEFLVQAEIRGIDPRSLYGAPANYIPRINTDGPSYPWSFGPERPITPSHDATGSTTPAWDPSSRTPGHESSTWANDRWRDETVSASASSSRSASKMVAPPVTDTLCNSWRYDARLHGKHLRVFHDGIKEPVHVVITDNGDIRSVGRKVEINYDPAKVRIKHPIMKDWCRWIVI